jgi:hypothetical protein
MPNPDMKFSLQPQWKFWLAKRFGKPITQINMYDQTRLEGYMWRGQMYITKIELMVDLANKQGEGRGE